MSQLDQDEFRRAAADALERMREVDRKRERREPGADQRWFIVQAVGKSDAFVLDRLSRMNIDTYYPKIMRLLPVPRRELSHAQRREGVEIRRPRFTPLFPRYIFARIAMSSDSWTDLRREVGIRGMVCEGDLPVAIKDSLIDKIRKREQEEGGIDAAMKAADVFGVGDEVKVVDGPFASFPGIVEEVLSTAIGELDPETRIRVAVSIFGRPTPVELTYSQVIKV